MVSQVKENGPEGNPPDQRNIIYFLWTYETSRYSRIQI